MKCNMSFRHKISKKEKEAIQKFVREESVEYMQRENMNCIRRTFKLIAVRLNERYGFGQKRLTELFNLCGEVSKNERLKDPVFWEHIDRKVIDELGLAFERENYEELER